MAYAKGAALGWIMQSVRARVAEARRQLEAATNEARQVNGLMAEHIGVAAVDVRALQERIEAYEAIPDEVVQPGGQSVTQEERA